MSSDTPASQRPQIVSLSESARQAVLESFVPSFNSRLRLIDWTSENGKQIAVFGIDENGAKHYFYDIGEDGRPFLLRTEDKAAVIAASAPTQVSSDPSAQKVAETPGESTDLNLFHPVASALLTLNEPQQRTWWKKQVLPIPYDGNTFTFGNVIGFQKTDSGHLGAIVADRHNTRVLYAVDFRSGVPRILGRPRAKREA